MKLQTICIEIPRPLGFFGEKNTLLIESPIFDADNPSDKRRAVVEMWRAASESKRPKRPITSPEPAPPDSCPPKVAELG